jgi:arylsulfatase A-like enzyme
MSRSRASALVAAIVLALAGAPVEAGMASPDEAAHRGSGVVPSAEQSSASLPAADSARPRRPAAGEGQPAVVADPPAPPVSGLTVPDSQPNIVVFYLDDTNPAQGLLWSNANRTPTLRSLFIDHGVSFPNAIGETPLCCPGRANLLTGLHTHNHGVTYNDVRLFNPSEHVGRALKESGYDTMWIGKYMNHPDRLSAADWNRHAAGWTQLDVFRNSAFDDAAKYYYDYTLYTKDDPDHTVRYGRYHSTRMISDRAVLRMRQTDAAKPLFMVLSIYDTHGPNIPMPEFKGDPRCQGIAPWKPPNYNEDDVSDKPAYVRQRAKLKQTSGWPMRTLCEEMLGVDWLVERVTDELAAQGRLDNTLLVFTADNGMAWGQHRLGQEKQNPYSTPVPLYMHWPAGLGTQPRTISDIASSIDLAPTFCALADGCVLGPFSTGQSGPDGVSLLPLLEDTAANLGRDAVLEGNYSKRPYTGLRTTPSNPLGRWHYIEYRDGFRELYNLASDPWELQNLAYRSSTASVRSALATRLAQLRREGRPGGGTSEALPDGFVAFTSSGTYVGNNIYSGTPLTEQTRKRTGVARSTDYYYWVRVQNDGSTAGTFTVLGESTGTATIATRYFANGVDVTASVKAGSYTISGLAPGAKVKLSIRHRVSSTAPLGAKMTTLVRVTSVDNATLLDVVRAVTVR